MAGGRGFEPRLMGPEPIVLPLNDPPVSLFLAKFSWKVKGKHDLTAKGELGGPITQGDRFSLQGL
jgi:hypothetical protein